MPQIVKLRRSSISGNKPDISQLALGEVAINTFDGKMFLKKSSSFGETIEEFIISNALNTGSLTISGSLHTFIGNTNISGTLRVTNGITGSLFGTASWALNAISSQNAQDILVYVKNVSGQQINKGSVVRISGATGDNALISLADWTDDANSANTLGLTTTNIANDAFGYVMTEGTLLGIDTSDYVAGQLLFLASSGSITGSAPLAPLHAVRLGQVLRVQQNNGSMYVRIDNGYEIDELHDVRITNPVTGQALVRSSSLWINGNPLSSSYSISSSYSDLSNIQYVTNSILPLSQIEVLDYDANVAVDFTNGRLKFIFGTPASQSITSFSFNSTFLTDRFNQILDDYTASAVWSNGGYSLISASIFEGPVLLAQTGTGTTLAFPTITSGSHTYTLFVTASNPSDGSILVRSASLAGTLNKVQPGNPTISPTPTVQLGAASNQIEQGATGSIAFTAAYGASNGWDQVSLVTVPATSPISVVNSLTGSANITIAASASYQSPAGANIPQLNTVTTALTTYTKIRSLRSGASPSSSFTEGELHNLSAWDTTLGGTIGTILKGTTTATGQSVTINWTGDKFHYIVYNGSLNFLTNITAAGFGVLGSFTSSSVGPYKVYRTTLLQAGAGGTTITYALT